MSKEIVLVTNRETFILNSKEYIFYKLSGGEVKLNTIAMDKLLDLQFSGFNRPECEQAYECIQLIPYIVLTKQDSELNTKSYVSYLRGKGGGEDRLHGKMSIGVGGHVSVTTMVVPNNFGDQFQLKNENNLVNILTMEIIKEIQEETGIVINKYLSLEDIRNKIMKSKAFLLEEGPNSVNSYHFAIPIEIDISAFSDDLHENEPGIVEKLSFSTSTELQEFANDGRLEAWSDIVLKNFV